MANYSVPQEVHLWEAKDRWPLDFFFFLPGWPLDHSLLLFVWVWPRTPNLRPISSSSMSQRIKDSQEQKQMWRSTIYTCSYSPNNLGWLSYHSRPAWYSVTCLPLPNLCLLPPSSRNLCTLIASRPDPTAEDRVLSAPHPHLLKIPFSSFNLSV